MGDNLELEKEKDKVVYFNIDTLERDLENANQSQQWQSDLLLDKHGNIKKARANLTRLLTKVDSNLVGLFRYNENTHDIEVTKIVELGDAGTVNSKSVFDEDNTVINQVASYISNTYFVDFKPNEIENEIKVAARQNSYNPIREFLEDCLSSSVSKDPFTIIQKYLNVEDTEYNRLVFDLFFRGAIGRVLDTGCQFDYCLDLTGQQGTGKTTFLREAFKGYYTEVDNFKDKDEAMKMVGAWVVNDDELVATNKTTFEELKRVITQRVIAYRPPYGRSIARTPIDFVFARTTNDFQHLKDATGDRRFLPVRTFPKEGQTQNVISKEDLRDLWGNYYRSYNENPVLYYEEESEEGRLIAEEREKYKVVDEDIERLQWYINQPIPKDFYDRGTGLHQRKEFYRELEEYGTAYKTNSDQTQGIEWVSILPRDKVTTSTTLEELYPLATTTEKKTLRAKIRRFMDNLPNWEKKNRVRIGNKNPVNGWVKKNNE